MKADEIAIVAAFLSIVACVISFFKAAAAKNAAKIAFMQAENAKDTAERFRRASRKIKTDLANIALTAEARESVKAKLTPEEQAWEKDYDILCETIERLEDELDSHNNTIQEIFDAGEKLCQYAMDQRDRLSEDMRPLYAQALENVTGNLPRHEFCTEDNARQRWAFFQKRFLDVVETTIERVRKLSDDHKLKKAGLSKRK
ncbi:MAG: hypothetical protein BWZ10_01206 [candidate division BRC1 bacterium ADurb.BinA364]|nr:MAG: hypothetical protein BWZ10_01206 [candidate division BRC1 bacterium ADurb.BinA364]